MCITGDITDPAFRSPLIALVQILNCVAVRPHGLSQTLATVYPYCNSYARRHAIGSLNRAIVDDRPQPGNIEICRPPSLSQGPLVVNIFGQFYMGKEKKKNFATKRLINQLEKDQADGPDKDVWENGHSKKGQKYLVPSDKHLLSGLLKDTTENRILWFREGLIQLAQRVPNEKFSQIIFPSRIGSGLAGGNWEKDYFPAIKEFARLVNQYGTKVQIVHKVVQKSDCEIAVIGTIRKTVKPL